MRKKRRNKANGDGNEFIGVKRRRTGFGSNNQSNFGENRSELYQSKSCNSLNDIQREIKRM